MTATAATAATAILAAGRACLLEHGIRRTTMSDIARRAGVSRATAYRHYPSLDAILRELIAAELGGLLDGVAATPAGATGRTRIVRRILAAVTALDANELFVKVVASEPETLLPYVLGRLGSAQRHAAALIAADVERGQRDRSVRPGDPQRIAQTLLLVAQAFVFALRGSAPDDREALLLELEHTAESVLAPGAPGRA